MPGMPRPADLRPHWESAALFAMVFAMACGFLAYLARHFLRTAVAPTGDYAMYMLWADRIRDQGYLLVGNPSRMRCDHPGPFFAYAFDVFDRLFSRALPSRYNVWILGEVILNACFTTVAATVLFPRPGTGVLLARAAFVLIALSVFNLYAIDFWMPYVVITPFLAFLATLPRLMDREFTWLPLSVCCACVLIHGYLTMPFITLPALAFAMAWGYFAHKGPWLPAEKKAVAWAAMVAGIFAFPILLDAFLGKPGNLLKILAAQQAQKQTPSWMEVLAFFKGYWVFQIDIPLYAAAMLGYFLLMRRKSPATQLPRLLPASAVITCLFFIAFKSTERPLMGYTAISYWTVPVTLLAYPFCCLLRGDAALPGGRWAQTLKAAVVALLIAGVGLQFTRLHSGPIPESGTAKRLSEGLQAAFAADEPIILDYTHHDMWTMAAGVLLDLTHAGRKVCTTWRNMEWMYTAKLACPESAVPNARLVWDVYCGEDCLVLDRNYGVLDTRRARLRVGDTATFYSRNLFLQGWKSDEGGLRRNFDPEPSIRFNLGSDSAAAGTLSLRMTALTDESLSVLINGRPAATAFLHPGDTTLSILLSPAFALGSWDNVIRFISRNEPGKTVEKGWRVAAVREGKRRLRYRESAFGIRWLRLSP